MLGTLGVPGGTPEWSDNLHNPDIDFGNYLAAHVTQEMAEELALELDDFRIRRVAWFQNFTRAPEPHFDIEVIGPTMADVAQRCYGQPSVLKEHDRIYAVSRSLAGLIALSQGVGGFNLNIPSRVGMYCFLGEK